MTQALLDVYLVTYSFTKQTYLGLGQVFAVHTTQTTDTIEYTNRGSDFEESKFEVSVIVYLLTNEIPREVT